MLTQLEIQNFKAFGDQVRLELRPLTILLGTNGSGKTSALDALGLLSQSVPSAEQGPQFKWKDRFVDFGVKGSSALHKLDAALNFSLAVEVEAGQHFLDWLRSKHEESSANAQTLGYRVGYCAESEEWKHELLVNGKVVATNHTMRLGRGLVRREQGSMLECDFPAPSERVFEPAATGNAALAPKLFIGTKAIGGNAVDEASQRQFLLFGLYTSYIGSYLRHRVFMVGPSRIPRRETPEIEAGPLAVGRSGERTITVLSVMFSHAKHAAQARKIQKWAEVFGMESLTSGWVREEFLHAGYSDSTLDTAMSIESAGSGAQQILPVIAQIFSAPKNSVILVEEPEAGLHPEAQIEVAKMLAEAVEHGHQLLVTTHSPTLLKALAHTGSANLLRQDDVAVYHLSKGSSGARAERLHLEDDWSIRGSIPSFSKVQEVLSRSGTAEASTASSHAHSVRAMAAKV